MRSNLESARRTHATNCQCDICKRADAAGIERRTAWHVCSGIGEDPMWRKWKCSLRRNGMIGGRGACVRQLGHEGDHRDRKGKTFTVADSTLRRAMKLSP